MIPPEPPTPAPPSINNPALKPELQSLLGSEGGTGYLGRLLPSLVGILFIVGVVVFFFMFLMGAIQWVSSGGDKGSLESARGRLSSAIIGLVILFSFFAIAKLIESFFQIDILNLDLTSLFITNS